MIPQRFAWWVARGYARLHARAARAGVRLRGLGWALRLLSSDRVLEVEGVRIHFDPRVRGAYNHLVAGEWNEPETGAFLKAVLDASSSGVTFVDVGANVGEILLPAAAHPNVAQVVAFEAHSICADVCERSAELNGFRNVVVHRAVVGDGSVRRFDANARNPNASGIGARGEPSKTLRLDDVLADVGAPAVLLVDAEGAEPLILEGARAFLECVRPLVVFEYNVVSRRHFHLDEVRALLPPAYRVYRLRGDGWLDDRVEESWNCVAVPAATPFEAICEARVRG